MKLQIQAFDHWFTNARQDSWFIASSLYAVIETLDSKPELWQWPTTGEFSRCIKAQDIPDIGEWKIFTIAELDKCRKKDIHKPIPQVLTHTTPSSKWEMLMPNSSLKELKKQDIRFDNKENKNQLINLLETQLRKIRRTHNQINSTYNEENHHTFDVNKFPLNPSWALKANQKFKRKGTEKRISSEIRVLLEGIQLATRTLLVSNLSGLPEGSTLAAIPTTQLRKLPI
ncbi:hypothetical protein C2G38_2169005 [Gigaspora rosea]|uniref:Uncharacterized protein n=1 Tax=Gigaspora rosea TaxID=44941 RepID=A0A397VTC7_9GLOM|nr:hypothetical protein C2G38_2169005 [Gigaspora rosea]